MSKSIERVVTEVLATSSTTIYPLSPVIDAVVAALKEAGYTDLPQEPEVEGYRARDRVQITVRHRFMEGKQGTVMEVHPKEHYWPILVRLDSGEDEVFDPHELQKVLS